MTEFVCRSIFAEPKDYMSQNETRTSGKPTNAELSAAVAKQAEILSIWEDTPSMEEVKGSSLPENLDNVAAEYHESLPYDELQGIFAADNYETPQQGKPTLPYYRRKFSEVMALRSNGEKPAFLAASAIPVDYNRRKLVLHRRGEDVKTYPAALHTVGGAFVPSEDATLFETLHREALEEACVSIDDFASGPDGDTKCRLIFGRELSTGSVQICYLHHSFQRAIGAGVPPMDRLEGQPVFLSFDELPAVLAESSWVPSGRMHLLAWLRDLAYEEPFVKHDFHFAGVSARALLAELLSTAWQPPKNAIVLDR
jgi:8-oxo-dGTP pyrophosphatase MutT (NUDIX family)